MKTSHPLTSAIALGLALGLGPEALAAPADAAAPLKLAGLWRLNRELSENPGAKMMDALRDRGGPGGGGRGMGGPGGGGMGGGGMGGPGGGGGMGGPGGGMGPGGGGGMGGPGGGRGGRGPGGPGMFAAEPPLDGTPEVGRPEGAGRRGGAPPAEGGDAGARSPQGPPPDREARQGQGGRRGPGGFGPIPSPEFTIEQDGDNLAMRTENNLRLLHTDGQKRRKEGEAGRFDVTARFVKGTLLIESRPETGGKRKETYTLLPDGKLQIDFELEGSGPMPDLKFKLVYEATAPSQF